MNRSMQSVLFCLCKVMVVVLVVVGDLAALLYGYLNGPRAGDGWFAAELVWEGVMLFCVLILPILAHWHQSISLGKLSQLWFSVHVTWGDNWASHAVVLLYNLQVQPVVDAFGLTSIAAELKDVEYWWWFAQGLLLVAWVRSFGSFDAEEDSAEEESQEMTEVVVAD